MAAPRQRLASAFARRARGRAAGLTLIALAAAPSAWAKAAQASRLTPPMPAQSLEARLTAIGLRSGADVLYPPDAVRGRSAVSTARAMPVRQALEAALVEHPDLEVVPNGPGAWTVRRRSSGPREAAASPVERRREPPLDLEQVVVTALRRPTLLQAAAASVTAITGERLDLFGADALLDIQRQAPGLNLTQNGPGQRRITLRGVQSSGENTVGLYVGDTPVAGPSTATSDVSQMNPELALVDVDRVEVLRGPQGTLYGSGALSGGLKILFNPPDPGAAYAQAGVSAVSVGAGGQGGGADVVLNAPILSGAGALRFVGYYDEAPGWVDNVALGQGDINAVTTQGWRLQAVLEPRTDLSLSLLALGQRQRVRDTSLTYEALGADLTDNAQRLPFPNDFQLQNLGLRWPLGGTVLNLSLSRYAWDTVRHIDSTRTGLAASQSGSWCPLFWSAEGCDADQLAGYRQYVSDVLPAVGRQPAKVVAYAYEGRLGSAPASDLAWTLGVFGEDRQDHSQSGTYSVDPVSGQMLDPQQRLFLRQVAIRTRQLAVFGEARLPVTPRVGLTVGARAYSYDKSAQSQVLQTSYLNGSVAGPVVRRGTSASGWVGKINLSYQAAPGLLAFVQLAEGFRPGGVNSVPNLAESLVAFRPDGVASLEAGLKGHWFSGKLAANLAVYRIEWRDMQVRTRIPSFTFVRNGGASRIDGLEVELEAAPIAGLRLRAAVSTLDGVLTKAQPANVVETPGLPGDAIPNEPDFTAFTSAEYGARIARDLRLVGAVSYAYTGRSGSQYRPTSPVFETMGGFGMLDASLTLEGPAWSARLVVANLFDAREPYKVESDLNSERLAQNAAPRSVRLSLSRRF